MSPRGGARLQAVAALSSVRGAEESATALSRLLADKDASQYGTTYLTADRVRQMLRRAQTLVDAMDRLLLT